MTRSGPDKPLPQVAAASLSDTLSHTHTHTSHTHSHTPHTRIAKHVEFCSIYEGLLSFMLRWSGPALQDSGSSVFLRTAVDLGQNRV